MFKKMSDLLFTLKKIEIDGQNLIASCDAGRTKLKF